MVKNIIKIIAGIFIASTAILGYYGIVILMYELTFISNITAGIVLIADGVMGLTLKKNIPALIYQMVLPCIITVFSTCVFALVGFFTFNFEGAFFFLHVINPPVFLLLYLFCVESNIESKGDYLKNTFLSPLMITGYLIFDFIRFFIVGFLVYGLIPAEIVTPVSAVLIGIVFYFLMALLCFGFIKLKLLCTKENKSFD